MKSDCQTIETNIFVGGPRDRQLYAVAPNTPVVKIQQHDPINIDINYPDRLFPLSYGYITPKETTYHKLTLHVRDTEFSMYIEESLTPEQAIEKILKKYVKRRKSKRYV